MKLLLDTHIWIWTLLQPEKISTRLAKLLSDGETEKWLSPISVWELIVLVQKGRIELNMDARGWALQALEDFPIREAPLTREVALAVPTISLPHQDPADAFLAATAKVFDLTLVTADSRLLAAKGISLLVSCPSDS